jgi:uncharacterized protein (TIGR03067 family)
MTVLPDSTTIKMPMKHFLCLTFLATAALTTFAADPHDTKPVQGDWVPLKAELGGQPMPDEILKTISLKLGDGTYAVLVGDKPDNGTFKVDSSATPKSMDVTGTDGPNQGKTFPAIYELEGDTLGICYDLSGAKRPTEFKTVAKTKLYLVTYQRKK